MTIEQVKEEAKKKFGKDLTDEQAQAILKGSGLGELSAQVLEEVTGGVRYELKVINQGQCCGRIDLYADMTQDQK